MSGSVTEGVFVRGFAGAASDYILLLFVFVYYLSRLVKKIVLWRFRLGEFNNWSIRSILTGFGSSLTRLAAGGLFLILLSSCVSSTSGVCYLVSVLDYATVYVLISSAFVSYCSSTEASRLGLLKFEWKSLIVRREILF